MKIRILILFMMVFVLYSCGAKGEDKSKPPTKQKTPISPEVKPKTPSILETNDSSFNPRTGEFIEDKYTLGLWHFNEGKEEFAFDSSKYENDGFITNPKWSDGVFSKCLNITSPGGALEIDDEENKLAPRDAITVEGWFLIRENQSAPYPILFQKRGYSIWLMNRQHNWYPKLTLIWGLGIIMSDRPEHVDSNMYWKELSGTWRYIAGTYNGEILKIYIDGNLKAQKKLKKGTTLIRHHSNLTIGKDGSNFLNGLIDEVRISNVARSARAIKQYYAQASKLIKK